jgi:hypothetical protein
MSDIGDQIIKSLQEAIDATESGKPISSSTWYLAEFPCRDCGTGRMTRRDRTDADGAFTVAFVCQNCNRAFWIEGGVE